MTKIIGIIPARFASQRFPGKPLADIGGKPMIQRVYEQAKKALLLSQVVVATDDHKIKDAVLSFGGQVIMTSSNHRSGTDRCAEAVEQLPDFFDVVINIQGDEPFIDPEQIDKVAGCFEDTRVQIATLAKKIVNLELLFNPNVPKVIFNRHNEAIYFSRYPIPYFRGEEEKNWLTKHTYYKHIGIYAYRASVLKDITQLPPSSLEIAESLEQLRWLENRYTIKIEITTHENISIDTPEDLAKVKYG